MVTEKYTDYNLKQTYKNKSLANDIFNTEKATMVGNFSHFHGDYPAMPHETTCKERWIASGEGNRVKKLSLVNFSQWRGYVAKSGNFIKPCPHCEYERVKGFCKIIDAASLLSSLKYSKGTVLEIKKIQNRLRKRRQKGTAAKYTSFPMAAGRVVLLHDAPDIDGRPLPPNRANLYELVSQWALATPKGKRAGHGLKSWGPQLKPKTRNLKLDKQTSNKWRIIGKGDFTKLLSAIEGEPTGIKINPKGMKVDFDASWFIDVVEKCGIDYAIDGKITLSACSAKDISTKCDSKGHECIKIDDKTAIQPILLPISGGGYHNVS